MIPSLSLSFAANFIVFILICPFVLRKVGFRQIVNHKRFIFLFAPVISIRAITNLLAPRFTFALYVQLITLATPFLVGLLSKVVLREALPRCFLPTLFISMAGSLLVLLGGLSGVSEGEGGEITVSAMVHVYYRN